MLEDTSWHAKMLAAPELATGDELLARGRAEAQSIKLGTNAFLRDKRVASETEYKRRLTSEGRMMQHAHIGFRDVGRTVDAMREVHDTCAATGVRIDRFGITLDWSMGYPAEAREGKPNGTGIILSSPEDFGQITNAVPVATHFGDFMLGFPGSLENARGAIAAGATSLGNLGQYFTFRMPYWPDDISPTEATVQAMGLIVEQEAEILIHSNLDDGFAGMFVDTACGLGMAIVEKYIIETLIGGKLAHCFGNHFSDPVTRMAFHGALTRVNDTPGTMIYGNTVSYQSKGEVNYASLATYLLPDILSLRRWKSGHAINPVPVTENERIPDTDEIIAAQQFAARLTELAEPYERLTNWDEVDALSDRLVEGGQAFADNMLSGLADWGVDCQDPAALMLAVRRMGARRLEDTFGPGEPGVKRRPLVHAEWALELERKAEIWVAGQGGANPAYAGLTVCIASSDVHEHGKHYVARALEGLGLTVVDAGASTDAEDLVACALETGADILAISTYNGVALDYTRRTMAALEAARSDLPVIVGGRLNQIGTQSNSGLPVDVSEEIDAAGALACDSLDMVLPLLDRLSDG